MAPKDYDHSDFFIDLVNKGVFKIYKNGKIYKCKKKMWGKNKYKKIKPNEVKYKNPKGYIIIRALKNSKSLGIGAHKLMWIYFNGFIAEGLEVNYKDGIKDNNKLNNLELMTCSQNQLHAYRVLNRETPKGSKNPNSKLKEDDIRKIKELKNKNVSQCKIADIFKVSERQISRILFNKRWGYIK